jgi:hypothetical protein
MNLLTEYSNTDLATLSPEEKRKLAEALIEDAKPETWKAVARIDKDGDGDVLYESSKGRYLVACETPQCLYGDIDGYVLDKKELAAGAVTLGDGEFSYTLPRISGHHYRTTRDGALRLHKALYKLGAMPQHITFSVTFDALEGK